MHRAIFCVDIAKVSGAVGLRRDLVAGGTIEISGIRNGERGRYLYIHQERATEKIYY